MAVRFQYLLNPTSARCFNLTLCCCLICSVVASWTHTVNLIERNAAANSIFGSVSANALAANRNDTCLCQILR